MTHSIIVKFEDVEKKIINLRNEKIILDSDIALLYGVETKEVNRAVKNNPDKFPEGYVFTLKKSEKTEVVKNFHHLFKLKFSPQLPKAFTEKGLYMLATILKSEKATQTTISIIEAFAKIKNISRNIKYFKEAEDENRKHNILKKSSKLIAEIFDDDLKVNESETTIEINFAVVKFKHRFKKNN